MADKETRAHEARQEIFQPGLGRQPEEPDDYWQFRSQNHRLTATRQDPQNGMWFGWCQCDKKFYEALQGDVFDIHDAHVELAYDQRGDVDA